MSRTSQKAMRGGCRGNLLGLIIGAASGLACGVAFFGNNPVWPPSDDWERETVRRIQMAGNKVAKFLAGTVGLALSGMVGGMVGAGVGARAATKDTEPPPPGSPGPTI